MDLNTCIPIFFRQKNNILGLEYFGACDEWQVQISLLEFVYRYRENLDYNNYEETLLNFIKMSEGMFLYPYYCPAGVITIGGGLALRAKNSTSLNDFAIRAFKFIGRDLSELNDLLDTYVSNKIHILKEDEANNLLLFCLDEFEKSIIKILPFFNSLALNIKIAIKSLHYNYPNFIYGNFAINLRKYYETHDQTFLERLLYIICRECNRGAPYNGKQVTVPHWKGLQYRRYREMLMCSNNTIDKQFFPELYRAFA